MFRVLLIFLLTSPIVSYTQQQSLIYQIRFERNKYELSVQNKQLLSFISDSLIGRNDFIIYVNGHTDNDADSSYNQQLSLKRSLAVKAFLTEKGIDSTFLRVQALGEEQPLVANTSPLKKAKNRRVELIVLFQQNPQEKIVPIKKEMNVPTYEGDTTVRLDGDYILTLSKSDWRKNSQCLRVWKRTLYNFKIKENWLKKHIGFKNYKKVISYEPYYKFYVISCLDSCFQKPMKLSIPHFQAPGLKVGVKYNQKKNKSGTPIPLIFKKAKIGDSAYYVTEIFCPGTFNCGTDNRCTHLVNLYAKNNISILSYSYYVRSHTLLFDSLVESKPLTSKRITDEYTHAFFHTLKIFYNGDTITLKNIPIDVFAHGAKRIKSNFYETEKSYFLFIPFRKKYKCTHFKKYKIRAKDIENLKNFYLEDLQIEN